MDDHAHPVCGTIRTSSQEQPPTLSDLEPNRHRDDRDLLGNGAIIRKPGSERIGLYSTA